MRCRALEAHHALSLGVTVGHVVWVVTDVFLSSVGQPLVTRGLIGHTMGTLTMGTVVTMYCILGPGSWSDHLEECGLTSLSYRVEAKLVETARGGDGGVIVDSLATVNSPVVVAVVVDGTVAVKHQAVLTGLFRQGSWDITMSLPCHYYDLSGQ